MPISGVAKLFANVRANDVGIIGDPVEHSLSPVIQNAAFHTWKGVFEEDGGYSPQYHKFHITPDGLKDAIDMLKRYKLRGLNVTVPHKVEVMKFLDEIDPMAQNVGAINTIVNNNGKLTGYNTDANGFDQAVTHDLEFEPSGKTALLLGAGGTGRVIAHKLVDWGMKVYWWNRSADKVKAMMKDSPTLKPIEVVTDDHIADI
jgi:shikimate dehydrogenase